LIFTKIEWERRCTSEKRRESERVSHAAEDEEKMRREATVTQSNPRNPKPKMLKGGITPPSEFRVKGLDVLRNREE